VGIESSSVPRASPDRPPQSHRLRHTRGLAIIRQAQGTICVAQAASQADLTPTTTSADPGPPQARNEGVTKLVVRVSKVTGPCHLALLLSPDAQATVPEMQPLKE